jgi:hypothetical protein
MHHPLETAVAVAAALIAVAFGLSTFERWLAKRQPHELAWSVALAMFAVAAAALAGGAQAGWSTGLFRLFYLFGAIVNVPFLALGTVYLLAGRRIGDRVAAGVALGSAFAAGVLVMAPFRAALPADQLAQGSRVFAAWPRILAGVASAGGAVVIFGGAGWSAWRVWRNRAARRLLASNALIAIGTLILASSGTLNSVFGAMTAFAVTLLAGIVVLFCGFLLASAPRPADRPAIPPAPRWRPPAPLRPLPVEKGAHAGAASRPGHAAVTAKR